MQIRSGQSGVLFEPRAAHSIDLSDGLAIGGRPACPRCINQLLQRHRIEVVHRLGSQLLPHLSARRIERRLAFRRTLRIELIHAVNDVADADVTGGARQHIATAWTAETLDKFVAPKQREQMFEV